MKRKGQLILALLVMFGGLINVEARSMTLDDLSEKVEEWDEEKDVYTASLFVIGKYAFPSNHILTTQDLMVASRTIDVKDASKIYEEMNVYELERVGDTWEVTGNILGKKEFPEEFELEYFDNIFVPEATKINVTLAEGNVSTLNFPGNDPSLKLDKGKLTGTVKYTPEVNEKYNSKNGTGYYFLYRLTIDGDVTSDTIVEVKLRNGETKKIDLNGQKTIDILAAIDPNDENKEITLTVDLDGYAKNAYDKKVYKFDYSEVEFQQPSEVNLGLSLDKVGKDGQTYNEILSSLVGFQGYATITGDEKLELNYDEEKGKWLLTGDLVKLPEIYFNGKEKEALPGYYFAYTLDALNASASDLENVYIKLNSGKELNYAAFDAETGLVLFHKLDENKEIKEFSITIDFDKDGLKYYETKITIDYSNVNFKENSLNGIRENEVGLIKEEEMLNKVLDIKREYKLDGILLKKDEERC